MFVGNSFDRSTPPFERKICTRALGLRKVPTVSLASVWSHVCMHAFVRIRSVPRCASVNSYILNRFAIGGPMQLVRGTDANWNSIRIDWVSCAWFVFSLQNIFFLARGGFFRYCPPPALVRGKLSSHFVHIYSNLTI